MEEQPGRPGSVIVPRAFVLALTVGFVLLCTVPYAVAVWRTPAGTRFNGVLLNHFDQNYYQAAQRSTAHSLASRNRFTAEPGAPGPVAPLYPLLGRVQRVTGLPAAVAYHLPRVLAAAALPALLLYLFRLCFPGRPEPAMWAVLFALFTAGVLTLAPGLPFSPRSGEAIPESNTLYSLAVFPHFAVSYVGITAAFTSLAMALRGHRPWQIAAVAVAGGVLLGLGHGFLLAPFVVVLVGALVATTVCGIRRGVRSPTMVRLAAAAAILIPTAPVLLALRHEQTRLERLQGFRFPTSEADSWWTWAVGYGVVSLFAVAGSVGLLRARRRDPLAWLLMGWIGVQAAFIYLPVTVFERRFSEGLILPVAGVAAVGVTLVPDRWQGAHAFRVCILGLLAVGAVLIGNVVGSSGQYVQDDVVNVLATVRADDVVLAGNKVSAVLPAMSDGTSHAGRPVETLAYSEKRDKATRYARDPTSEASRRWLAQEGITMVVVLATDPSFAPGELEDPAAGCLRRVFHDRETVAYRVQFTCMRAIAPRAGSSEPGEG